MIRNHFAEQPIHLALEERGFQRQSEDRYSFPEVSRFQIRIERQYYWMKSHTPRIIGGLPAGRIVHLVRIYGITEEGEEIDMPISPVGALKLLTSEGSDLFARWKAYYDKHRAYKWA